MIDTLYPISTLNQQITNLEQTHIRCSFHCERWTVKGRDCASALHSLKEITYRTDEWMKQLPRLKSWVISGNPAQWMEICRLWWTVIVFKCSQLFHLFDIYCLLVHYLLLRTLGRPRMSTRPILHCANLAECWLVDIQEITDLFWFVFFEHSRRRKANGWLLEQNQVLDTWGFSEILFIYSIELCSKKYCICLFSLRTLTTRVFTI